MEAQWSLNWLSAVIFFLNSCREICNQRQQLLSNVCFEKCQIAYSDPWIMCFDGSAGVSVLCNRTFAAFKFSQHRYAGSVLKFECNCVFKGVMLSLSLI